MVKVQTVKQAVNKHTVISFDVTTSSAASTTVVTAATIAAAGCLTIRSIHMIVTGGDGFLGLGKTATAAVGTDIIPIYNGVPLDFEGCMYETLNVIRSGAPDVQVQGWVVVN